MLDSQKLFSESSSMTPPSRTLCPEITEETISSCPVFCPNGTLCDGSKCVHPLDCPCVQDGKIFQVVKWLLMIFVWTTINKF